MTKNAAKNVNRVLYEIIFILPNYKPIFFKILSTGSSEDSFHGGGRYTTKKFGYLSSFLQK